MTDTGKLVSMWAPREAPGTVAEAAQRYRDAREAMLRAGQFVTALEDALQEAERRREQTIEAYRRAETALTEAAAQPTEPA